MYRLRIWQRSEAMENIRLPARQGKGVISSGLIWVLEHRKIVLEYGVFFTLYIVFYFIGRLFLGQLLMGMGQVRELILTQAVIRQLIDGILIIWTSFCLFRGRKIAVKNGPID